MNRRHFLTTICLGAVAASAAHAKTYEESVIAQLRAQGYSRIAVEHTLLGRVKISANLNGGRREIILNPRTGEILRDLWVAAEGGKAAPGIISDNHGGSDGGSDTSGGNHGGGDDDDKDDDKDDDNSGNSGGSDGGNGGDDSDDD